MIQEKILYPNGVLLHLNLSLGKEQHLSFSDNEFIIILPNQLIQEYTPTKSGIHFQFQLDQDHSHQLVFEVDIKKPSLGSKNPKNL